MDGIGEGRGAAAVAATFSGRAAGARPALIDGAPGMMWAQGGQIRVVFDFTIVGGKIVAIEMIADPEHLAELDVVPARRSAWLNGSS
jgi:RNA polymerase sigma-70 factor (ECF subfamily)